MAPLALLAWHPQRYVFSLLDLFDQAEDLEDTEALHTIYRIFRNLIMLNEPNLLEVIFQKVLFMRVMGVLECTYSAAALVSSAFTKH